MKRFSNILFVAESHVDDPVVFNQAITLASNNQAQITVVGVVDSLDVPKASAHTASDLLDAMIRQRQEQLETLVLSGSESAPKMETKILVGKPFIEIIREVIGHQRDLVIKSVGNIKDMRQQLFSSTDKKLLRKCPCPVWLIKSTEQQGYREILVGLDYEPENPENEALNLQILEMASSLALSESSQLHVVHAWYFPHESFLRSPRVGNTEAEVGAMVEEEESKRRRWLSNIVEKGCAAQGREAASYLDPQLHLAKGNAQIVVPQLAKELGAKLVVMGTVGRTGIPGYIMGNTAETILSRVDCSVLTVKPRGFISPVT